MSNKWHLCPNSGNLAWPALLGQDGLQGWKGVSTIKSGEMSGMDGRSSAKAASLKGLHLKARLRKAALAIRLSGPGYLGIFLNFHSLILMAK